MASLNRCTFIGNLGRDPEIRAMQDGKEIANMSLGVSDSWVDKNTGEKKSKTEWIKITVFNQNLVKIVKNYLHKGSKIYVEGQMQTRKYTDKDGAEKYSTEIVLQNFGGTIIMLDGKKQDSAASPEQHSQPTQTHPHNDLSDDIPFAWAALIPFIGLIWGMA